MADVFLSYAKENKEDIRRLAAALEDEGLDVFWDFELTPGKSWRESLGDELDKARVIVVCWSNASVGSDYVIEEAEAGRQSQKLRPVLLEKVREIPFGFQNIHAQDLSTWDGSPDAPVFRTLVDSITHLLGSGPDSTGKLERAATRSISHDRRALLRLLALVYGPGLVIVCLSLWLSYGPFASPAWIVEFGWALSEWPAGGFAEGEEPANLGWLWEGLRAVIAFTGCILFFAFSAPVGSQELLGLRAAPSSRGLWLKVCRGIGVLVLVGIGGYLVAYHIHVAPRALAGLTEDAPTTAPADNIWLNFKKQLADAQPAWYQRFERQHGAAPESVEAESGFKWYRLPYLLYLPYSSVLYLLIGAPFFVIALYSIGVEISYGKGWRETLGRRVRETEACPTLVSVFEHGCTKKAEAIARLGFAGMVLALFLSFEYWVGQYTSAALAARLGWITLAVVATGPLILGGYIAIYVPLARRAHLRSVELDCGGEPRRYFQRSQGVVGFLRRILRGCWPFHLAFIFLLIAALPQLVSREAEAAGPAPPPRRPPQAGAVLETASGKITMLRVHEVGTGRLSAGDRLDAEVVFRLDSQPEMTFGFELRKDENLATHQGMLDLLRGAFENGWTVSTDYRVGDVGSPPKSTLVFRISVTR